MRDGDAIRTYKARRRVTSGQAEAIARLLPRFGAHVPFDRQAPLVLEIGSGMGEATAAMAAADPDRDVLAVEVHTPGLGTLLRRIEDASRFIDLGQLALSPQCGFASGLSGNDLSHDQQWRKLEVILETARRVWH